MPDEDTQADPLDETVDKVDPEFGGLKKPEAMSILQVLDKLEDVWYLAFQVWFFLFHYRIIML